MSKKVKLSKNPTLSGELENKQVQLTISIDPVAAKLLGVLSDDGKPETTLLILADHAQQGVYRPGAWEREWLWPVFGSEWTNKLEPGDPYGRPNCAHVFQRPEAPEQGTGRAS